MNYVWWSFLKNYERDINEEFDDMEWRIIRAAGVSLNGNDGLFLVNIFY